MKILGNRILVSKVEEEKKEGFQTVEVQDSFVNKGKVEQVGNTEMPVTYKGNQYFYPGIAVGSTVLFAKYSPDTQEIEHEGKKMKIIRVEDVLAIL